MAVFTPLAEHELAAVLLPYNLGRLYSVTGIATGSENSNFKLHTERGDYALTLFEVLDYRELAYFIALLRFLHQAGIACPEPIADRYGRYLHISKSRPTLLLSWQAGDSRTQHSPSHCYQVGLYLAQLHLALRRFQLRKPNSRGLEWCQHTAARLQAALPAQRWQHLQREWRLQHTLSPYLPRGVIHGDLFCDNLLWQHGTISAVLDWYYAGDDAWLYDLAVTAQDWCTTATTHTPRAELDWHCLQALLQGYHAIRPLTHAERLAWPLLLRRAALRFALARTLDAEQRTPILGATRPAEPFWQRWEWLLQHQHILTDCWPNSAQALNA